MLYMLLEIVERRSPVTNRKSIVYRFKCDACAAIIEGSKTRDLGVMHFCDNKCRGRYKHDHPETWQKAIEALNSPESHAKARATIQEKAARGEWRHWLGKTHTEETKRHLSEVSRGGKRSGANNGMFGRRHSESAKARMSEAKARLINEGRFPIHGTCNKKGWYTSTKTGQACFFRSSWEEALMKWLDSSSDVATWEYERLRIPYHYSVENRQRWYVPDFVVTRVDGCRQVIEVKPKEFIEAERVKLKREAAEKWCLANGAIYVTATRQVLSEWGIYPS